MLSKVPNSGMCQNMTTCWLWLLVLLSLLSTTLPPTSAQQLSSSSSSSIFDPDFLGYGYGDLRAKRQDMSGACSRCIATYDPDSCLRCWSSKVSIVPFFAKRNGDESPLIPDQGKRGYEPFVRYNRGSGCGCCYLSRFSNYHCCNVCSLASKRTGKRSGMTSEGAVDKRAFLANPDCFCCYRSASDACCSRCFAK